MAPDETPPSRDALPAAPGAGPGGSASYPAVPSSDRRALDRRAVERVLARAAELQGVSGDTDSDAIDESRLLDIAREAGLAETSVRQALAEERTRVETDVDDGRLLTRLTGPGIVTATRVVSGTVGSVVSTLDGWMQMEEGLVVQRRFADRMVWEPSRDWVGALRRGLRLGGRAYHLARARQVAATVVPLHTGSVLVRLDADVSHARGARVRAGTATTAVGVVSGGTIVLIGSLAHAAALAVLGVAAMPVAVAGGAAWLVLRKHRAFAARTALALEQVLDQLEYGNAPRPSPLLDLLTRARPRAQYR